ncbi:MAG: corrinoid ABC transporter substrate-binding protein [Candidatus Methanolliviera sp. GoM_oil]|nr:MAG: corrinoid ABC transporter substrate-binding protein [Candidatus Methanolliviera sp. GoM_oil]
MNRKIVGMMLAFMIVCTMLLVPQADAQKTVTIVDSMGNRVKIPYPVERVVNVNLFADEAIVALGGEDKLVGIDLIPLAEPEFYPTLQDKPSVGLHHFPSYEKIIDLEPDVVIAASDLMFLPGFKEKMEAAGIKVVYLNLWDPGTYDRDIKNLGIILGEEKRAKEYIKFVHSYVKMVEDRVKNIPSDERVDVYWEFHFPYMTMAKGSPIDKFIEMAGGRNVFAGGGGEFQTPVIPGLPAGMKVSTGLPLRTVSQEAIVEKNPQVIIGEFIPMSVMTKGIGKMIKGEPYQMPIGYTDKPDVNILKSSRDEIMNRPGSSAIDAVRNERVYIFPFSMLLTSTRWPVGLVYLGKCFYPDQFEDVDPDEFHAKWLKKWNGLEYKGVYVYP